MRAERSPARTRGRAIANAPGTRGGSRGGASGVPAGSEAARQRPSGHSSTLAPAGTPAAEYATRSLGRPPESRTVTTSAAPEASFELLRAGQGWRLATRDE